MGSFVLFFRVTPFIHGFLASSFSDFVASRWLRPSIDSDHGRTPEGSLHVRQSNPFINLGHPSGISVGNIRTGYQIHLGYLSEMWIFFWGIHLRYERQLKMSISFWDVRLGYPTGLSYSQMDVISQTFVRISHDVRIPDGRIYSKGQPYPRRISQMDLILQMDLISRIDLIPQIDVVSQMDFESCYGKTAPKLPGPAHGT